MTREEAIKFLKLDKENRGKCFISDAIDVAIKALEQEPTDNDVVLTYNAYHDLIADRAEKLEQESILDKIRAEIEDLDRFYDNDYFSGNRDSMFKCKEVMEILDKYKVESEEEE